MDFLWHEVDESEKADIEKQAKSIMEGFSKKLSKIDKKLLKDVEIERPQGERQEGDGFEGSKEFRERMFENAPLKDKDFIVAERKRW